MGSRSTNNSLQTAPVYHMAGGESTSTSHTVTSLDESPTTSQAVVSGGEGGISPALASFIAQTVQAALAAERSAQSSPPVSTTPPQSTAVEVPNSSVPVSMASSCFGGVPSSLGSSASNFLAVGTGLSQQGRPAFSLDLVVPSFVSTFANPLMSASVSSPSVHSSQNGATRDVADCSAVLALPLLDQPFIVGPGFSPVPAKLVTQIVAGKYIDLSDLLAANLVQREPEPQLLFDGCSTFIQPVRQPVALLWCPPMTHLSRQVPPRPLSIANPGTRGVARLRSPSAATPTGAVSAQAFIDQSPALTSRPKNAVTNPNVIAVLQVPRGRPPGLRLPVLEFISDRLCLGADSWRILAYRFCDGY